MRYSKKIEDRIADIGQIVLGMEFKKLLLLYLLIINFTSRKTHFKGYKSGLGNFMYLAINTGSSTSISSTDIIFLTKLQKRQILEKGSALFKNDITDFLPAPEIKIHSRNQKCG